MSSAGVNLPASFPPMALPTLSPSNRHIIVPVLISLLIHGIGLGWLPGLTRQMNDVAQTLQIFLPAPQPKTIPEAVAMPPPMPTTKAARREAEAPKHEVVPLVTNSTTSTPDDAPAIRAPVPALVDTSEPAAPVRPQVPLPPKQADAEVLAGYGRQLADAVATHQRYPRIALLRQWHGTVVLQLEFGGEGRLSAVRVLSSSGYEVLDKQALEMVREATPLPQLPAALAGRPLTVDVPVVFRITS